MDCILAFDGGATKTRAGLYDAGGTLLAQAVGSGTNPYECGEAACAATLLRQGRELLDGDVRVRRVAAGIAGLSEDASRRRIGQRLFELPGVEEVLITDDRVPLLHANAKDSGVVLAMAGTGSGVAAMSHEGTCLYMGGRGGFLGDGGSAYRLVQRALRAAARGHDGVGPETALTAVVLDATQSTGFEQLTAWAGRASKREIAGLAAHVTACAEKEDQVAVACLEREAIELAEYVAAAFERLSLPRITPVYCSGGLFEGSELYRQQFEFCLHENAGIESVGFAPVRGADAVAALALRAEQPEGVSVFARPEEGPAKDLEPTERKLTGGPTLDHLSAVEIVRLMNAEDGEMIRAVAREEGAIAEAMEMVARCFASGGRLVYVGAGTSGRLGVLDASECPPTFGSPPEQVVGLIAGGDVALRTSVEGAEDDPAQGAADLESLVPPLGPDDVVVGIAASGRTPYVHGALARAKERGTATVLVCGNPACQGMASVVIAVDTGPEVLTGSTRLKAGTAAKLVLNMLTTGAMALSGHIYDGLMVGMKPANAKLRIRAARIIAALAEVEQTEAARLLEVAEGEIGVAIVMGRKQIDCADARRMLEAAGGVLREVIG